MASRMDKREIAAEPTLDSNSTTSSVNAARPMLATEPWDGSPSAPMDHPAATGMSVTPMVVMTTPETTGGKNRMTFAKKGARMKPSAEATSTAPKITRRPSLPGVPCKMVSMVATPAKETPCTNGNCAPRKGTPMLCRMVARPPTNRAAATRMPVSVASRPAAVPMINGTAITPPYMVKTCWRP